MYAIASQPRAPRSTPAGSGGPAVDGARDGDVADADSSQVETETKRLTSLMAALAAQRAAQQQDEIVIEGERQAFDQMMQQRAELERERNALQALAMEQRKHDDEILKEWIKMI